VRRHPYCCRPPDRKVQNTTVQSPGKTARTHRKAIRHSAGRYIAVHFVAHWTADSHSAVCRTMASCISASYCFRRDQMANSSAAWTILRIRRRWTANSSDGTKNCCSSGCSRSRAVSVRLGAVPPSSDGSAKAALPDLLRIAASSADCLASRSSQAVVALNAALVTARTCPVPVNHRSSSDVHPCR
jgi:hypothetical protein